MGYLFTSRSMIAAAEFDRSPTPAEFHAVTSHDFRHFEFL